MKRDKPEVVEAKSMRLVVVFMLFIFSSLSWAVGYKIFTSSFYPALDIYEVSTALADFQFDELDLSQKGRVFSEGIDQIYFNPNNKNDLAVLKLDLEYQSSERFLKLSESEFVCHGKTRRGRSFSLFVKGRSEAAFSKICKSVTTKTVSAARFKLYNLLWEQAFAANGSACSGVKNFRDSISNLQNRLSESPIMQKLGTCLAESFRGAKGVFEGIRDGFQSLLSSPRDLWSEIKEQASALLNFVGHLKEEVVQLVQGLGDLDMDLAINLGCNLGGELLASSLVAAVTGVGLVKLSAALGQALLKLNGMKSIFARLNQLKSLGKAGIAKDILSCAAR